MKQIQINLTTEQYGSLAAMCTAMGTTTQRFFEDNFMRARDSLVARYAEIQAKQSQSPVTIEIIDVEEPSE